MEGSILDTDPQTKPFSMKPGWEKAPIIDGGKGFSIRWEKASRYGKDFFARIIYGGECCYAIPRSADIGKIKHIGQISFCQFTQVPAYQKDGAAAHTVMIVMAKATFNKIQR